MTPDPLTPELQMQSLHHFKWWWLFARQGKPAVLYRRRVPKSDDFVIEWGDLESNFFTNDDVRRDFQKAWDEHMAWVKANA